MKILSKIKMPFTLKTLIIIITIIIALALWGFYIAVDNGTYFSVPDYSMEDSYWIYVIEDDDGTIVEKTIVEVYDHGRRIDQYFPHGKPLYIKEWTTWRACYGITNKGEQVVYRYDVDIQFNENDMIITHTDENTGEILFQRKFTKHVPTKEERDTYWATPFEQTLVSD